MYKRLEEVFEVVFSNVYYPFEPQSTYSLVVESSIPPHLTHKYISRKISQIMTKKDMGIYEFQRNLKMILFDFSVVPQTTKKWVKYFGPT